jgi:hypothetical protein
MPLGGCTPWLHPVPCAPDMILRMQRRGQVTQPKLGRREHARTHSKEVHQCCQPPCAATVWQHPKADALTVDRSAASE